MFEPLFAFTADWHIAKSAWVNSGINGDSYFALGQVGDYCVEHSIPLLAGGDLFDSMFPSPEDEDAVRAVLTRMRRDNLAVYYTQGQHERMRGMPRLSGIHSWPLHIDRKGVEIGGLKIYGLDWRSATILPQHLAEIPEDTDVLLCHQVWTNLMGNAPKAKCEGSFEDVPYASLILTGDFHQHKRVDYVRNDGVKCVALSPGSLCMQSINEENPKHFYVIGRDDAGCIEARSVPLYGRFSSHYSVKDSAGLDELIANQFAYLDDVCAQVAAKGVLPPELHMPLVRVSYPRGLADAGTRLEAAAAGKYHLFLDVVDAEAAGEDEVDHKAVMRELRERGMHGVLATMALDDLTDPEQVRRDVASLLAAQDPVAVLDEMCR